MPVPAAAAVVAVFLNGHQIMLPTAAVQDGGTVLVPVKGLFDRLGATISWDSQAKSVIIAAHDMRLHFAIDSTEAELNGQRINLGLKPQLREGNALVPLRLVTTALGADVVWDQQRRRVYVQAASRKPLARVTVGELAARPYEWLGRMVMVVGEYRGWEPSPLSATTRCGVPVSRRDWVLRDATGEIYCRGDITIASPFPLTPYSNVGKRIAVAGMAKVAKQGFVFIEPREIAQIPPPEGLVCTVSTSRRAYVEGEKVRIRLRVANPFAFPVSLSANPGPSHDVVIKDRDGRELWRLSKASPPGRAADTITLAAGEGAQVEEVWSPGSVDSPPLPPGRYTVEGEWAGVLRSYPHMIAIVPRED